MNNKISTVLLVSLIFAFCKSSPGQDWAVWRGHAQNGTGVTADSRFAKTKHLKLNWNRVLGAGYSRVSAIENNLLATFADKRSDWVGAFDTKTGDERWRFRMGPMYRAHDGGHDGPLSTPVAKDDRVFALNAKGILFCVDLESGKEIWKVDCKAMFSASEPFWGFCATPSIHNDKIIVPLGGRGESGIVAFDTSNGSIKWRVPFGRIEYRSPIIASINGQPVFVAASDRETRGVDPETGKTLWTYDFRSSNDMTPVIVGKNRILLTGRTGVDLIEISTSNDVKLLWETRELDGNYDTAVAYDGHIYGFTDNLLTCVDAESGKRKWRSRQPDGMGLIVVDGQLISFSAKGHVTMAPATADGYQETCRIKVSTANSYSSPIAADGQIFVRDLKGEVFAVGTSEQLTWSAETILPPDSEFAEFLSSVETADNKKDLVNNFMKQQSSYPLWEDGFVHFVYRGNAEDVAISGSMLDGGEQDQMERLAGTDLFHKSYKIEPGSRLEYRFVVDFDRRTTDPLNSNRAFNDQRLSQVELPGWTEPEFAQKKSNPRNTNLRSFSSSGGSARVWLPDSYSESDQRYPLFVFTEGNEWIEQGSMPAILQHFAENGGLEAIVMFVSSSGNREMGGSNTRQFARRIATEFFPAVEAEYRVSKNPADRTIVGKRGAAVAAVYTSLKYPKVFGKCIAVSYGRADTVREDDIAELANSLDEDKPQIWLYWNRYEVSRPQSFDCRIQSRQLGELLKKNEFDVQTIERNDSSNWRSWRILAGSGIKANLKK